MVSNSDDLERILNLTKIMSLKIAQLSPENQIHAQLENLGYIKTDHEKIISEYKKQAEQISPLLQQVSKLEKELNEYRENFDSSARSTIEQIQQEKGELEEKYQNLSEELTNIKIKSTEQNEIIEKLTVENQESNNKLQGQWQANQEVRKALLKERNIINQLNARIQDLKNTLRRLQRRLIRGGKLYGLYIPVEKIEETEISSQDNKEQIEQMKFELSKRLDKITELEMKNRELKNQIMKSPTKDLELQIQSLQKEMGTRDGKIATFEAERKKLEEQIGILQNRITDLQVSFQDQSKGVSDREKKIADLENTMRLGIHEKSARDLVIDLQEKNKKLQEQLRQKEKDVTTLDKNSFFYKQQLDVMKSQVQTLYAKNREYLTKLQQGGTVSKAEIDRGMDVLEGTTEFDKEMKDQAHKLKRLEGMTQNLEQEISDLRFALHSKDAKIEELNQIMSELKITLANAKIQVGTTKKKKAS